MGLGLVRVKVTATKTDLNSPTKTDSSSKKVMAIVTHLPLQTVKGFLTNSVKGFLTNSATNLDSTMDSVKEYHFPYSTDSSSG